MLRSRCSDSLMDSNVRIRNIISKAKGRSKGAIASDARSASERELGKTDLDV